MPTRVAAGLLKNEQIRTRDVARFEERWELLDKAGVAVDASGT